MQLSKLLIFSRKFSAKPVKTLASAVKSQINPTKLKDDPSTFRFPFSQVGRPRYVSRRCGSCRASCRIFTSRALFWQPFTRSSTPGVQSPTAPSTSSTGPYWSDSVTGKNHMRVICKGENGQNISSHTGKAHGNANIHSFCKQFSR